MNDAIGSHVYKSQTKDLFFGCGSRDGLFDQDQLFAIWEPDDIGELIGVLQTAQGIVSREGEDAAAASVSEAN
jgi:hypothetical protein